MPAVAVAEANHLIGADHNAWTALLYPADVTIAPLDSGRPSTSAHSPAESPHVTSCMRPMP